VEIKAVIMSKDAADILDANLNAFLDLTIFDIRF
jgi:hypothetical protein